MTAIDSGGDNGPSVRSGGEQRQRRHSGKFAVPGDGQSLCSGNADADAGEAAGPDSDEDPIGASALEKLVEHRHQTLAMAAADQLVTVRRGSRPSPSNSAAVQAAVDVSIARIIDAKSEPVCGLNTTPRFPWA